VPKEAEGLDPVSKLFSVSVPSCQTYRQQVVKHHDNTTENVGSVKPGNGVVNTKKRTVLRLVGVETLNVLGENFHLGMMFLLVPGINVQPKIDRTDPGLAADVLVDPAGTPKIRMRLFILIADN